VTNDEASSVVTTALFMQNCDSKGREMGQNKCNIQLSFLSNRISLSQVDSQQDADRNIQFASVSTQKVKNAV
jgi:hypothetical protein